MNLEQALQAYIGHSVEVYTSNAFVEGTLLATAVGVLSVDSESSTYYSSSGPVNVPIANLSYVRVVTAAS